MVLDENQRRSEMRTLQDKWDTMHREGWGTNEPHQEWIFRHIQEHCAGIGNKILDLGCGQGRSLIPSVKVGLDVTGLDLSTDGLDIAKKRLDEGNLPAKLVCGSVQHLPFKEKEFDSVLSIQVLSHLRWSEIEQTMQEVRRVLKDNGIFIWRARSISHNNLKPRECVEDFGCTYVETAGSKTGVIQHSFTDDEMHLLARKHDFEIVFGPFETKNEREPKPRMNAHWNVVFRKQEQSIMQVDDAANKKLLAAAEMLVAGKEEHEEAKIVGIDIEAVVTVGQGVYKRIQGIFGADEALKHAISKMAEEINPDDAGEVTDFKFFQNRPVSRMFLGPLVNRDIGSHIGSRPDVWRRSGGSKHQS